MDGTHPDLVFGQNLVQNVSAYKKGTFNQSTETTGLGSSNIMFKNAETSAVVDANGNYNISRTDSCH